MGTHSAQIKEMVSARLGLAPADIAAAKTGPYVSMAMHRQALAVLTTAPLAVGKKATVEILQARDAAGAGAKPVAVGDVVAPAGGGSVVVTVNVSSAELEDGFEFIAIKASSDNGAAVQASAALVLGGGRFRP